MGSSGDTLTIAFKSLPVETLGPAQSNIEDDVEKAPKTCKDAVQQIVEALERACSDFGIVDALFTKEQDIVR